jgi:hypothetical protein
LLPYGYFTLERIGVLDRMKASHFVRKHTEQFVGASGRTSVPFCFSQQLAHEASATWQVLRSEFDQLMLDNAREKGAEVIEEITVRTDVRTGYSGCPAACPNRRGTRPRLVPRLAAIERKTCFSRPPAWSGIL